MKELNMTIRDSSKFYNSPVIQEELKDLCSSIFNVKMRDIDYDITLHEKYKRVELTFLDKKQAKKFYNFISELINL